MLYGHCADRGWPARDRIQLLQWVRVLRSRRGQNRARRDGLRRSDHILAEDEVMTDSPEEPIMVMRPYPHIICNAARPDECERQTDGSCPKCHIPAFHAGKPPANGVSEL